VEDIAQSNVKSWPDFFEVLGSRVNMSMGAQRFKLTITQRSSVFKLLLQPFPSRASVVIRFRIEGQLGIQKSV